MGTDFLIIIFKRDRKFLSKLSYLENSLTMNLLAKCIETLKNAKHEKLR